MNYFPVGRLASSLMPVPTLTVNVYVFRKSEGFIVFDVEELPLSHFSLAFGYLSSICFTDNTSSSDDMYKDIVLVCPLYSLNAGE